MTAKRNFWKSALMMGAPFGLVMGLQRGMSKGLISGIYSGFFQGAFFGLFMAWTFGKFSASKIVEYQVKIELPQGEITVFEAPANNMKGIEGRGGRLYLTNKNLIFKAHRFNIQKSDIVVPLAAITNVCPSKTLGLLNNGITVTTAIDKFKFIAEGNTLWCEKIRLSLIHI